MLEITPPSSESASPTTAVDDRSDAELDALPYGVIALDAEGTVLRYNLYESRLARLDRNQVLGKSFFGEVAPCARTDAFEGRFRSFVAAGTSEVDRFEYVFDFTFGAQHVLIELTRAANAKRFYLFINRQRIAPPREGIPAEVLAPRQSDLAPNETAKGVLRDELARRIIDVPASFLAALRATCDRLAPDTWPLFSNEWGVQWGRRAAVELEAAALEEKGRSIRDLSMRHAAALVAAYLADRGWGALAFDFELASEGLLIVEIERSALAEAAPRRVGGEHDLACHLLAGYLAGVLGGLADRRLSAREITCAAGGASRCTIIVVGHERRDAIDTSLKMGVRDLPGIRTALRHPPRRVSDTQ